MSTPEDDGAAAAAQAKVPPRWFVRSAWAVHRAIYRVSSGRWGLTRPRAGKYGMMRLHTIGRRSGKARVAIVAYFEDGPNLVTMAMNGWGEPPPAWWLNLKSNPEAAVDLPDGHRLVRAGEATGAERDRLWARFREYSEGSDLDALAKLRSRETPIVVLRPAVAPGSPSY